MGLKIKLRPAASSSGLLVSLPAQQQAGHTSVLAFLLEAEKAQETWKRKAPRALRGTGARVPVSQPASAAWAAWAAKEPGANAEDRGAPLQDVWRDAQLEQASRRARVERQAAARLALQREREAKQAARREQSAREAEERRRKAEAEQEEQEAARAAARERERQQRKEIRQTVNMDEQGIMAGDEDEDMGGF